MSDQVSEMIKTAGETGVDMTTDLANQIIVEGAVPAGWELSIVYFTFNFNLKITLLHVY